ncbi:hypothetical protein PoB_003368100 [Plakobranchus ocellatus]|uniref:Uncharacterized protein n=1 Tax=Plakobranchus ocellatus TaxID=259542 RepID=A0AAV4AFU0_9GAST|nr:hypothetical protein PoB_003368100 [Plakobranchus ocellatus]
MLFPLVTQLTGSTSLAVDQWPTHHWPLTSSILSTDWNDEGELKLASTATLPCKQLRLSFQFSLDSWAADFYACLFFYLVQVIVGVSVNLQFISTVKDRTNLC